MFFFNVEAGQATIRDTIPEVQMSLTDAAIGLKAYKEVDQRMALLWHNIDQALVGPRTNLATQPLPGVECLDVSEVGMQRDQRIWNGS